MNYLLRYCTRVQNNFQQLKTKKMIKLENGWYKSETKQLDNIVIVGLLRIKNNFFFENDYLKGNFIIDNTIPTSVIISTTQISLGKNIKSKNGEYLFSLIPIVGNTDLNEKGNNFLTVLLILGFILFLAFVSKVILVLDNSKHSNIYIFSICFITVLIIFGLSYFKIPKFIFGREFESIRSCVFFTKWHLAHVFVSPLPILRARPRYAP